MRKIWIFALAAVLLGAGGPMSSLFALDGRNDACAAKLATFVRDLDDLLSQHPSDLTVILALVQRHIPVKGCTSDVASRVMKTSIYFKGEERVSHGTQFSIYNGTTSSRGASILLVLNDNGNWSSPFAIWYPPYL
jgi:hypothetical protein